MPPYKKYVSEKQRAWAHTAEGKAALGDAEVAGKDSASKGVKLPERSLKAAHTISKSAKHTMKKTTMRKKMVKKIGAKSRLGRLR